MIYECLITYRREDGPKIEHALANGFPERLLPWKCSKIDGDPVLGKEVFFYLTTHSADFLSMMKKMSGTIQLLQANALVFPVREKIELIVYDKRHS